MPSPNILSLGSEIHEPAATRPYRVSEQPLGTIKPLRIITIGAGASGINMAYQTKHHLREVEMVCYEKNPDIGGTWFENTYPGCKCDVPSHNYQFTWEPNPDWSGLFSTNWEIHAYLKHCVKSWCAFWNNNKATWTVKVEDVDRKVVFDDWCHILLNCGGILNTWKWPGIPGLHAFKGQLIHSANWPKEEDAVDLHGKTVAVVGNGSTGIQIVPALQPHVKKLVHLIRSPTWVTPGAASRDPSLRGGGDIPDKFSEEQKEHFRSNSDQYKQFIRQIERESNAKFRMLFHGAEAAETARKNNTDSMMKLLGERAAGLGPEIIPEFAVGCRRITPGVGYLESFSKPNVQVITNTSIERVEPDGIVLADGKKIELDALICATGFDVSFAPRFPITGRNGADLAERWSEPNIPRAYLSLAIPAFPNYFSKCLISHPTTSSRHLQGKRTQSLTSRHNPVFLGPNAPVAHGSIFTITEHVSKYVMQMVTKMQTEMIRTIEAKQSAMDDFTAHVEAFMPRTAWAGKCRSWFKRGTSDGPVVAVHPGSRVRVHWFHCLERPRFEDFEYEYDTGHRFQYLGDGFSVREEPEGYNPWYLDEVDPEYLHY